MANTIKVAAAKIIDQKSHLVAGKLKITEHWFDVLKDYSRPEAGTIRLFARSARKHDKSADAEEHKKQLPWMVYLQGGPGMRCPPPEHHPATQIILDKGYQLLFLDQRGTGMSTPVTPSTLGLRGYNPVQAEYLKKFRADNIVRDCESVRQALLADYPADKRKWSTIGQSYGGFATITYLSYYPHGLRECFIFGGLQPLVKHPDAIYRNLYNKVIERNEAYYEKYPEDVEKVKRVVKYLQRFGDGTIKLPSEGHLTARRFQQLGLLFGGHGGLDTVHNIILQCAYDIENFGHLTRGALSAIDRSQPFDDNILYAVFQEIIYCEGTAPNWSAERIREEFPQFSLDTTGPIFFTGEMVYPWMFDDYSELRKVKPVAELVASDENWPALFNEEQLAKNEVPVFASAYVDDMYVDFDMARETAAKIKGCKMFVTNVMYHDAIRSKTEMVVSQLFTLRDDVLD